MIRTLAIFFLLVASSAAQTNSFALPPVDNTNRVTRVETLAEQSQEVVGSSFRKGLRKALPEAVKSGAITRQQANTIRLASLSPAFREKAKTLGAIQMTMSGVDVPLDANGIVDVDQIPWEVATLPQWIEFIKAILEMLREFGIL